MKISANDFDERVFNSKGSENIVAVILDSNKNKALCISDILNAVNYRKKNRLNRSNVQRVFSNIEKYNKELLNCKVVVGIKYYWLEKDKVPIFKTDIKLSSKKNNSTKKKENSPKITDGEKRHYEPTRKFLSSFPLNNLKYEYKIMGDAPLDRNIKFSNPDLIGICKHPSLDSYHTVTVEVKDLIDKSSALTGFAQCCIYRTFSHYVIFACAKLVTEDQKFLLNRICDLCEYYGIGFWIIGESNFRTPPKKNEIAGNSELKNKIISNFNTKLGN